MRSLGFDAPDELLVDEHAVVVDIYTETPGGDDEDGNPQPPQRTYYVQDAPCDVQPRSGAQRAAQSGTVYESTHVLYLAPSDGWPGDLLALGSNGLPASLSWPEDAPADVLIQAFFHELAGTIPVGATVETRTRQGTPIRTYTVVFVASWGTHLEIDLKAV